MSEIGQTITTGELNALVNDVFPPVSHVLGYGSGVFAQQSRADTSRMIDIILVVDDALRFHEENLQRNARHYSTVCRIGGAPFCSSLQRHYGAQVFFHALIETAGGKLIKYGVVEHAHLKQDLTEWNHLYLAGRMHKPTLPIQTDPEIQDAQETQNLPAALSAALLLLSNDDDNDDDHKEGVAYSVHNQHGIPFSALFETIANLSYQGDPRLDVGGEDPRKVHNLVHAPGQMERFVGLYENAMNDLVNEGALTVSNGHIQWNPQDFRPHLQKRLPPRFASSRDLREQLRTTVRASSRPQSYKGIITAGVSKSVSYALAKLSKGRLKGVL